MGNVTRRVIGTFVCEVSGLKGTEKNVGEFAERSLPDENGRTEAAGLLRPASW